MAIKKLDVVTQVCPFPLIEAKQHWQEWPAAMSW
ncbi:SirA family protein [Escherichia coli]|uniref:SirA family protein n=1 Tax=Escherichia coli TaxID=562 RepID=A0A376U6U8_ECOLX|nr:SirA family protein [Escherichia coli]